MTAIAPAAAATDFLDEAYWRAAFPALSIGERLASGKKPSGIVAMQTLSLARERVLQEGYFDGKDPVLADLAAPLAEAIIRLKTLGLPPPFIYLFDESWAAFYRLHPTLSYLLGADYRMLPDFWAWHVDPQAGESGWKPHRDKGRGSLFPDGSPRSLTVWIPLTEALPINGCMYVLPADRDPVYNTPEERQFLIDPPSIRALPAKPGEYLCWNQALLHWGAKSSPYAPHARMSMAFEFQRGDLAPFNTPLLTSLANLSFGDRLQLIAKQILQYTHMYPLTPDVETLARQILA